MKGELEKAERDKEDLKTTYNNYFLQVQTLINQKAIGSPKEATRKKQEETGSNQEENRKFQEASRPAQKEEKGQIEKICKYCGKPFYTDNVQKEYCCKEHKDAAYNEKRRKERNENRKKEASG